MQTLDRLSQNKSNQAKINQDSSWITPNLIKQLPQVNFFRFCQWIEQRTRSRLGEEQTPKAEVLRFRPHPGMGFPASELKSIIIDDYHKCRPPAVTTTFLGLYGVDSPLPTSYVDDISLQREGTESLKAFLDIFNHRITTQYYQIWKKYSYPASFERGGLDVTSQSLLGLIGFGINGSATHLATPLSRFLALLGPMCLPTRTVEGLHAVVKLLAPNTDTRITPHYPVPVEIDKPVQLRKGKPIKLSARAVLGKSAIDCNSELKLEMITEDTAEAITWLFDGQTYQDLLLLMRGYLAYRCTVKILLIVPKIFIPQAQLKKQCIQLGRTAILGWKGQLDESYEYQTGAKQTSKKTHGVKQHSDDKQQNNKKKGTPNRIKNRQYQIEECTEMMDVSTKICQYNQHNQWVTVRLGHYVGLTA